MMDMLQRIYRRLLQIIWSCVAFGVLIFVLVCISFMEVVKFWFNCTKTVFLRISSIIYNTLTKVSEESVPSDASASASGLEIAPIQDAVFVPTTIRKHHKRLVQRSPNINPLPFMKYSEVLDVFNPRLPEPLTGTEVNKLQARQPHPTVFGASCNVSQFHGSPVALTTRTNPAMNPAVFGLSVPFCEDPSKIDEMRRAYKFEVSSNLNQSSARSCQNTSCIASEFYRFATPDSRQVPMKDYVSLKYEGKVKLRSPPTFERIRGLKSSEASPYEIPSNVVSYHAFSIAPKPLQFLRESTAIQDSPYTMSASLCLVSNKTS